MTRRDVEIAFFELACKKAKTPAHDAAYTFAQDAFNGIKAEFNAGIRTPDDIIEAQNDLFKQEIALFWYRALVSYCRQVT